MPKRRAIPPNASPEFDELRRRGNFMSKEEYDHLYRQAEETYLKRQARSEGRIVGFFTGVVIAFLCVVADRIMKGSFE